MKAESSGACGGSLPVPGRKTERYGGNTSCVEVRSELGTIYVVVDAGTGIRKLGKELVADTDAGKSEVHLAHQPHALGPYPGAAVLLAAVSEGQPPVCTRASATTCTCAPCSPPRRMILTSRSRSRRPRPTSRSASCRTWRQFEISDVKKSRARASIIPYVATAYRLTSSTARASCTYSDTALFSDILFEDQFNRAAPGTRRRAARLSICQKPGAHARGHRAPVRGR